MSDPAQPSGSRVTAPPPEPSEAMVETRRRSPGDLTELEEAVIRAIRDGLEPDEIMTEVAWALDQGWTLKLRADQLYAEGVIAGGRS